MNDPWLNAKQPKDGWIGMTVPQAVSKDVIDRAYALHNEGKDVMLACNGKFIGRMGAKGWEPS